MDEDIVRDGFLKYNPRFGLYAMNQDHRGLVVNRVSDSSSIVRINVRDINLVLDYYWDPVEGKYISLFLRDGSVRIYNIFNEGKLVSLLRVLPIRFGGSKPSISKCLWDRILLPSEEESSLRIPYSDATKNMPKLVKFVVESKQIDIIPYRNMTKVWKSIEDSSKKLIDIHMGYVQESTDLQILIDGEYLLHPLSLTDVSKELKPVTIMKSLVNKNGYNIWFQDNSCVEIDLSQLVMDPDKLAVIESINSMRSLYNFLQDHINLIEKSLMDPYYEFLESIRGIDDSSVLEELFLIGQVDETLQHWFVDTINEKNLKKWTRLGNELYSNFKQILILVFIPVCEQLLVLVTRVNGMMRSLYLSQQEQDVLGTTLLENTRIQQVLKDVIVLIEDINEEEKCFKENFMPWLTDKVYESINEDYKSTFFKPSNGNNKSILTIINYFKATVIELDKSLRIRIQELKEMTTQFKDQLQQYDDEIAKPRLAKGIDVITKPSKSNTRLLGLRQLSRDMDILIQITEDNGLLHVSLINDTGKLVTTEQYRTLLNNYNYQISPGDITSVVIVEIEEPQEEDMYMHKVLGDNKQAQNTINIPAVFETTMDVEVENTIQITLAPPTIRLVYN